MQYRLCALVAVIGIALTAAVPALAFDCTVANKPPLAGAVGIVDITTGAFTPLKSNPGSDAQPHGAGLTQTRANRARSLRFDRTDQGEERG